MDSHYKYKYPTFEAPENYFRQKIIETVLKYALDPFLNGFQLKQYIVH